MKGARKYSATALRRTISCKITILGVFGMGFCGVVKVLCYSITGGEEACALDMAQHRPLLAFVYSHFRASVNERLNLKPNWSYMTAYSKLILKRTSQKF